MKRFKFRRRTWILLAVVVAAAVAAVSGYAYFAGTGSGSGTAYIAAAPTVTVTPAWPAGVYLYPGTYVTVPLTITNTSTQSTAHVGSVSGSIGTTPAGCDNTWFVVSADPANVTLAANGGSTVVNGYVSMTETNTDQSACEGATPNVNWNVAP